MGRRPIVIVGAGPCAASAAATLRASGAEDRVVVIGDEQVVPYERPPLSKDYLLGAVDAEQLALRPGSWYEQHGVELWLGTRVVGVDPRDHAVLLRGGERLEYAKLLLATGGRPRRLDGVSDGRVGYLRTVDDARALVGRLRPGEPLVVLGGGFIGCEVAAAARRLGVEVTVLEQEQVPLQRALGTRFGAVIEQIHRDEGVRFRTGERVHAVTGTRDGLVVTTDRGTLECATLLAAVGLVPNTEVVHGTGIRCANGVLVDRYCRTAVPDVYAAGDVAAHHHPAHQRHIRVEHHDNAIKQGAAAARNMLGEEVLYADPHWFWSDQYAHSLQSVGIPDGCDEVVVRGSVEDRAFSVFSLRGGRVRAVFALDRAKDILAGRTLIAAEALVEPEQLRDETVDLKRLVPAGGR